MPQFSVTLFDFLIYLAPGYVILFSLKDRLSLVGDLFKVISTASNGSNTTSPQSLAVVLILSFAAMAMGVVVAGLASVSILRLAKCKSDATEDLNYRNLSFLKIYGQPEFAVAAYQQHVRVFQANGNMAVALVLSIIIHTINQVAPPSNFDKLESPLDFLIKVGFFTVLAGFMISVAITHCRFVFQIANEYSRNSTDQNQAAQSDAT